MDDTKKEVVVEEPLNEKKAPTSDPPSPTSSPKPAIQPIARKPLPAAGLNGENKSRAASTSSFKDAASARGVSRPTSLEIDKSLPADFEGELATNNEIPSQETLRKIEDYVVLDRDGKTHTFKSLYQGPNVARRVLIIFVRHFFCGNCQEFLRTLSEIVRPDALLRLPVSTFIAVVGCGDPSLINMYAEATSCPFPIYTDPQRTIFDALGMTKTWEMGEKPSYMRKTMTRNVIDSIFQAVKQIPSGKVLKSGEFNRVGGEFLFEPLEFTTPFSSPREEKKMGLEERMEGVGGKSDNVAADTPTGPVEEKKITWCHRMKTTRDHAEIPELLEILGLDELSPMLNKDERRFSDVNRVRKGSGTSMAKRMSQMTTERMSIERQSLDKRDFS